MNCVEKLRITIAVCGIVATLTSCGPDAPEEQLPNSAPSSTVTIAMTKTVEPAPHQPERARTAVEYDPCFTLPDQVVASLGFDPTTRERRDWVSDDYALIGCDFDRKEKSRFSDRMGRVGGLWVYSSNITLDELRQRGFKNARDTVVNGRSAMFYSDNPERECDIVMTGPDGSVDVRLSDSPETDWVACDHIQEAAEAVEAVLPDEK